MKRTGERTRAEEELKCITADLRSYFIHHPSAADTVEGIKLWLARQRLELPESRIREALDHLVDEGMVAIRKSQEGPEKDLFYRTRRSYST